MSDLGDYIRGLRSESAPTPPAPEPAAPSSLDDYVKGLRAPTAPAPKPDRSLTLVAPTQRSGSVEPAPGEPAPAPAPQPAHWASGSRILGGITKSLGEVVTGVQGLEKLIRGHVSGEAPLKMPSMEEVEATAAGITAPQVGEAAAKLLGGEHIVESIRQGSLEPLQENFGEAIFDLATSPVRLAPLAAGAASLARAARPAIAAAPGGERVLRGVDAAGRAIIPKYGWTDEMYAIEAQRAGTRLTGQLGPVRQVVEETDELARLYPDAVRALEPRTRTTRGANPGFRYVVGADARHFQRLPPDAQQRVLQIRDTIDQLHVQMRDRGLVDEKTFQGKFSRYLHQVYKVHYNRAEWVKEVENNRPQLIAAAALHLANRYNLSDPDAISTARHILHGTDQGRWSGLEGPFRQESRFLTERRHLSKPIRALLGPLDPDQWAVRAGQTVDAQIRMLTTDSALTRMLGTKAADGRPLLMPKLDPVNARPAGTRGYTQLPDTITFTDKWQGSWVHPDVADAVISSYTDTITGPLQRYLGLWKSGVVTWNVPTHINNMMGNVVFSTLAGNSSLNPMNLGYYMKATRDMAGFIKNPSAARPAELNEAIRAGAVVPGFAASEIGLVYNQLAGSQAQNFFEKWVDALTKSNANQLVLRAYDGEDQIVRYATFLKYRQQGMRPDQAAVEVSKYFPSYEITSRLGAFARGQEKLGGLPAQVAGPMVMGPFASFPLEAARIYMTAAREHPFRFMATQSLPLTATLGGAAAAGLTMEDYHEQRNRLAPWQRGRVLIPYPGGDGKIEYLDWTNFFPLFGALRESPFEGLGMMQGPLWIGPEIYFNRDSRTGQPLYDPAKGETFARDGVSTALSKVLPLPSMFKQGAKGIKAWYEDRPQRIGQQEVEGPLTVGARAVVPMFTPQPGEELDAAAEAYTRGKLAEARRGRKSIQRRETLSGGDKERRIENIDDYIRSLRRNR